MRKLILASTAMLLSSAGAVAQTDTAQQEQDATAGGNGQQVAQECLERISQLSQEMREEGYWLTGYRRGWGWRGYGMTAAPGAVPPRVATDPTVTAEPAVDPATQDVTTGMGPWGDTGWGTSPGHEIRVLQNAAVVLARQGDAEGCELLGDKAYETYEQYRSQLQEAGVDPEEISAWRQQQIASARPAPEIENVVSVDAITGTDVRSMKDEDIGSAEDVIMNQDGSIGYVVVGHSGFFGIGQEYSAVPWEMLYATPGLDTLLLDAAPEVVENAPRVQPEQLSSREAYTEATQEIDQYWQQTQGG